jgi:FG-GAP repeat
VKRNVFGALALALITGALADGCGGDSEGGTVSNAGSGGGKSGDSGVGGGTGGGSGGLTEGGTCPGGDPACAGSCCATGEFCALDTVCAPTQDPCTTADDCWFDSYCEGGQCIPYGVPPDKINDPTCEVKIDINAIVPAEQCRWTGPPSGDPFPNHYQVMATPVVVDFNFDDDDKTLAPSIVFASFPTSGSYSNPGVLRVIDGQDCTQQFSMNDPADAVMSPASAAVGDIDGDGRAEIVAAAHGGGLLAFKYDSSTKTFARLWRSGTCSGGVPPATPDSTGGADKWSGPSIHDLDDDGSPEIIYGATVYGANGCMKSSTLGFPGYSKGYVPVIADVDEDGKMELVLGNGIYEWNGSDWAAEPYFTGTSNAAGQVAVADLGSFPLASQGNQDRPEVAVISAGAARVQTIEGTIVFGPVSIPGGGTGGPPTIADFDGDGRREFASAGGSDYVVFDFDCLAGGNPANCGGQAKTTGVLWAQPSQDASSNVTGSSVFDFDANGSAEAVYADECYLRVYEGATGKVIYSAARSSGTTYENPVIVDVDGDYRTEIVSAVNDYAGTLGCAAADPLYPSAQFSTNHGIVVLRDIEDRWAASRPVWNQHAYAVTHVGDHGEIPKTSAVKLNWKDPTLNNFRQNVQGDLTALGDPDLTAGGDVGAVKCNGNIATIEAQVCNRGTLPMVSGTEVAFYETDETGPVLCTAPIPVALGVGECMVVSCDADLGGKTVDVFVKVDPQSLSEECHENNNAALYKGVACGQVPH